MYFDEDLLLDLRLNSLNKFVKKFVITEATYTHNGTKKKLNFDINKFEKFKNKIIYLVVDNQPKNIQSISDKDPKEKKGEKLILNGMARDYFQRENLSRGIKDASDEDLIIISDLDEIPNLNNFSYKNKITIFKQKMFYYKLNLEYPDFDWMGSKICKVKHLIGPQWLRSVKAKKYPFWRIDVLFNNKKYSNLNFINSGGWHFTNIMSPEMMDKKMRSFAHHVEYEESGYNSDKLKKLIQSKKVLYNHSADKKDSNKFQEGKSLKSSSMANLPEYININQSKFKDWID